MTKKIILAIAIAVCSVSVYAQKVEEVTLTVSGDGATKKEATELALRSAIEQAFGVFVSANTTILDDELVKDEIATVSSGNIKKYEEIAAAALPNGNTTVTLKAVVSVSKLQTYAQSKGSSAEFAGATFGMNMRLKELNKANEEKAIENMVSQLEALVPSMFDYKLEIGEPVVNQNGDYNIPAKVVVIFNGNTEMATNILINTLQSLSLTDKEKEEYEQIGIKTIRIGIGNLDYMYNYCKVNDGRPKPAIKAKFKKPLGTDFRWGEILSLQQYQEHICTDCQVIDYYFLRSEQSLKQLQSLNKIFSSSVFNFKIASNTEIVSLLEGDFEDIKSLNPIGLISKYDYPITGRDKTSSISYPSYNYYKYAIKSSHNHENGIWISNGKIVVPHLFKNMLAKYNDDLVPYILNITLTIPKDDIVKYNNFTITHKEVK